MTDIADDNAAYREAMARAEAASGIERDARGNETNGIEAIVRGETPAVTSEPVVAVPVQASDQQLAPDPVTPAIPAATDTSVQEAAPAEPLSVEELSQQLAVATARLEEKDSFIGKQSTDVGELRQTVAELSARLDAQQAQPVQPSVAATTVVTQELIDTNPSLAAEAAYTQGDENALRFVMEQWKDVDPFTASSWRDDKLREQQQKAFDAKLAEQEAKIAAVAAPVAESAAQTADQQQWKEAFDDVRVKYPEVFVPAPDTGVSIAERLITAAGTQPEYAAFKEMLQTGDASAKAAAISALYALDKVGNPEAFKAQLELDAQEAVAAAAAARAGASVVNGQITAGQGGELKTEQELEADAVVTRMRSKPSLSKGWTGR